MRNAQSTATPRIWVPAFAGMTESGIVFWPKCEKLIKKLPTNSFKEPKIIQNDSPDFVAIYPILLQESRFFYRFSKNLKQMDYE